MAHIFRQSLLEGSRSVHTAVLCTHRGARNSCVARREPDRGVQTLLSFSLQSAWPLTMWSGCEYCEFWKVVWNRSRFRSSSPLLNVPVSVVVCLRLTAFSLPACVTSDWTSFPTKRLKILNKANMWLGAACACRSLCRIALNLLKSLAPQMLATYLRCINKAPAVLGAVLLTVCRATWKNKLSNVLLP